MANIYSVEQVNTYIKNMFGYDTVLSKISVKGEVSNCKYHTSGHIYFTIKEKGSSLSAVMFAGNRASMKFKMTDGMQIIASGNISTYEVAGTYQLYAKTIEQAGSGELYEKFLALRKELKEMGMFDPSFKQPIPQFVRTLGVVTAQTGAAIHDIINVATRRNPYVQIVLYPAQVQGEGAKESICNGIKALDRYGVDVMIVGRGGGSIEDLWAFNEELVARAIFNCKTPIISAVGHETDITIADYVADLRAPTPSAAAELAITDIFAIMQLTQEYQSKITRLFKDKIEYHRNRILFYSMKIGYLSPDNLINTKRQRLEELSIAMEHGMTDLLKARQNQYKVLCARLEGQSPLKKLTGGYSYTVNQQGTNIYEIEQVRPEEVLNIHVQDGFITAKVLDTTAVERMGES